MLWNVYRFFVTYANLDQWEPGKEKSEENSTKNILDRWVLMLLDQLKLDVTSSLENYDTVPSVSYLRNFINNFSRWYIRRSRERIGPSIYDFQTKENGGLKNGKKNE